LTLRIRIKRLARKTICFSKSIGLHNAMIGLCINRALLNLAMKRFLKALWLFSQADEIIGSFNNAINRYEFGRAV